MTTINPLLYVFFIISGISFLFGIFGIVLLLTLRQKKPSDMMLAHLTLCDMMNAVGNTAMVISFLRGTFRKQRVILRAVTFSTAIPQFLSLVIITIDRILAVNLVFRYRLVVTNKRLAYVLVSVWVLGVAYGGGVCWLPPSSGVQKHVILGLCIAAVLVFIVSYAYIIIKVHMARKAFSTAGQRSRQSRFNYRIPLTIILTYILLVVATNLSLEFDGVKITAWHWIAWNLNTLADTMTYVFGSARIRSRLTSWGRNSRRSRSTIGGSTARESGHDIQLSVIESKQQ